MNGEFQVVAMSVGSEVYGVGIDLVHTVILPQAITAVPRTPRHVLGVINLRGRIVPIVDLRTRFGLAKLAPEQLKQVRIVMVDLDGLHAGLVVDSVSEVVTIAEGNIELPSEYLAPETAYVTGIARTPDPRRGSGIEEAKERLILLLDVSKVIQGCGDEQTLVTKSKEAKASKKKGTKSAEQAAA